MRLQMSVRIAILSSILLYLQPAYISASGRIPTLSYRGHGQGKVVFDHQAHASAGFRCADCHTDFAGTRTVLFSTRRQGLISFADHTAGSKCFACHNGGPGRYSPSRQDAASDGKRAFYKCDGCHRKTGND
jgi:c(7)-type cytochrome triheme protein